MTTTVDKTIGSGGDYSTLALWIAACPANLVSSDQIWRGLCLNQAFTGGSVMLAISGITTDSTRYIHLTTASAASFRDNANVQTNALRWNSSNGASIEMTASYDTTITSSNAHFKISKLQVRNSSTGNSAAALICSGTGPVEIDGCILEVQSANSGVASMDISSGAVTLTNSLFVDRVGGKSYIVNLGPIVTAVNCTFAVPSDKTAATNAIRVNYPSSVLFKNCAFFGATNVIVNQAGAAPLATTLTTCYGDDASPPTGVTTAAYNTSTGSGFNGITDAARDYSLKSTSALLDVGTTDSTNAATDIAGTARPSGSAYDIGAWEYVVAGGPVTLALGGSAGTGGSGTAAPGFSIGL